MCSACRRPAEMQFLGKDDEVAQLPKLHALHPCSVVAVESLRSDQFAGSHWPSPVPKSKRRFRSSSRVMNAAHIGRFARDPARVG